MKSVDYLSFESLVILATKVDFQDTWSTHRTLSIMFRRNVEAEDKTDIEICLQQPRPLTILTAK